MPREMCEHVNTLDSSVAVKYFQTFLPSVMMQDCNISYNLIYCFNIVIVVHGFGDESHKGKHGRLAR